jgi:hypothetical protein
VEEDTAGHKNVGGTADPVVVGDWPCLLYRHGRKQSLRSAGFVTFPVPVVVVLECSICLVAAVHDPVSLVVAVDDSNYRREAEEVEERD